MKSFEDMSLPVEIQKALKALNFNEPTPIQAQTIPLASEGKDFMACAETGSGKTAAYAIPTVVSLLANKEKHALILAPTRELAQQIADFFRDLTKFCDGLSVTALIGGADIYKQFRSLKKNPRILVATPGRLTDHLHRKSLSLDNTEFLILDEGDRMLDMGFAPQLDEILKFLPKQRQTSLFTATLPDKVRKLAEKYLTKPEQVNVGRISLPVLTISQSVVEVASREKDNRLVDELNKRESSVIIFAKTKVKVDKIMNMLDSYGFKVDLIHGGRSQGQRNRALANFRAGKSRILCATDVASRGIDIPSVAHVINYDLPMMVEDYVHRIGRTGRNGASGEAVSFVTPDESRTWMMIAKKYQIKGVELKNAPAGGGRGRDGSEGRSGGRFGRGGSGGGRSGDRRSGGGASRGYEGRSSFASRRKPEEGFASFDPAVKAKRPRFDREDGAAAGERSEFSFKKKTFGRKPFGENADRPARKFDRKSEGEFKGEKREFGSGFKREEGASGPSKRYSSKKAGSSNASGEYGDKKFSSKKFGSKKFGSKKTGGFKKAGGSSFAGSRKSSSRSKSF